MTKRISKRQPVNLSRTLPNGDQRDYRGPFTDVRELGRTVAYYYSDNGVVTSRADASTLGMAAEAAFTAGVPFEAHGVTFTTTPAT